MARLSVEIVARDDSEQAFRKLEGGTKRAKKSTRNLLATFRDLTIVVTGAKRAMAAIGGTIRDVIGAAERQQQAEIKVAAALAKTEKDALGAFHRLREFNAAMQEATGVGDEFLFELQTVGATLGRMSEEQLKQATMASLDLAAAGKSAEGAMTNLARLLVSGQADFTRYGIVVQDTGTNVEKFNDAIRQMTTGAAELVGALPITQFRKLQNAWGDLQESLGFLISSTGTWNAVLSNLTGGIGSLASILRDPALIKHWGQAFDQFVVSALRNVRDALREVLRWIGKVATALSDLTAAIAFLPIVANTQFADAMKRMSLALSGVRIDMESARFSVSEFFGVLIGSIGPTQTFEDAIAKLIEKFRQVPPASQEAAHSFLTDWEGLGRQVSMILQEETDLLGNLITDDQKDEMLAEMEALGEAWASTLSGSFADAIQEAASPQEAFKMLGKSAKEAFIQQMSAEAFAPMRENFGRIATAMAQPFKIVGSIINDVILKPLADVATAIIGTLVKGLLKLFGLSAANVATSQAAVAAFGVAFLPVLAQLTAGAVAASISTLGAATAFGPAALAEVKAAAAIGAAGFQEGGLVFPEGERGRVVRVAEREPEFIVPSSGAAQFARQLGGGGDVHVTVEIGSVGGGLGEGDVAALADLLEETLEDRLAGFAGVGGV
ncbi:MAG: hypothetical protein ACE5FA_01865 [Dehalococcoidia bacterium]